MPADLSIAPPHVPSGRLAGMLAVITGAGSGVGAETARVFHAEGAYVLINSLEHPALEQVREELGMRVMVVQGDITLEPVRQLVVDTALGAMGGRIDVLVNNAGATVRGGIDAATPENFDEAVNVNLKSAVQMMRLVAPVMRSAARGSIINIASITSLRGVPGAVSYAAAKAGVTGATRAVAVEMAPFNVRVNAICPGVVDSPMTHRHADTMPDPLAHYRKLKARQPMNRLASARDCALAALFLASSDSSFITGVALPVDGGRHAI